MDIINDRIDKSDIKASKSQWFSRFTSLREKRVNPKRIFSWIASSFSLRLTPHFSLLTSHPSPRKAFTLAEVLITLGVIGIIASMTIPTLINNTNKIKYVVSLQKFYSEFNQILIQIGSDNGCINDLKCSGLFATGTTVAALGDEIVKYLKVIKNCGIALDQGCIPGIDGNFNGTAGPIYYDHTSYWYKVITADGMSLMIWNHSDDCAADPDTGMTQYCGAVYVDVNGLNPPNRYGRDFFIFYIINDNGPSIYPAGGSKDLQYPMATYCANPPGTGVLSLGCAGKIIADGWQMNY